MAQKVSLDKPYWKVLKHSILTGGMLRGVPTPAHLIVPLNELSERQRRKGAAEFMLLKHEIEEQKRRQIRKLL